MITVNNVKILDSVVYGMRKILMEFFVILIFTFGWSVLASAQENYEVRSIVFHGNKTLKKDLLLDGMVLKSVSFLQKLLTKDEPSLYSHELMNLDLTRIVSMYQSEGFLNASAELDPLKINDKKKTVKIIIQIHEDKPVLIDSVSIRMVYDSAQVNLDSITKKVYRKLELVKKKRFRDESLNLDVQTIADVFRNLGYAYVKTDYKLQLKPEELLTGIEYTVNPGPLCYFGETTIEGNKNVSEKFIKKQFSYKQGELYDKSHLTQTRKTLYQLQLFRVVSVLPQSNSKTRLNPIPVQVYIEEAPRLTTRFGVGYGTEDKFRAFLDLNYKGFLGGARQLNLNLKHSAIEPYSASLKWIQPQFLSKKSSIILNPFIIKNSEPGYVTQTYGLNIPVTYRFNDNLNSTLTYYLQRVQQDVGEGDEEIQYSEDGKFPYSKSGILLSSIFNDSKPRFSPTKGISASVGFKLNGHLFGSEFNYSSLWGEFRTYYEIGDVVLAFRILMGGTHSADTDQFIPVEDRFYSGGSNSVRGWNRSELGPKRTNGSPLGGKSVMEGNLEARYPLFWKVSGVVFLDSGNVWTGSYTYKVNELAYAVGGGLRVETPIGPVRFDVGFPVWNEKKSPQFFISVGQAF